MRDTRLLRKLINLKNLYVRGCEFGSSGLIIDVAPSWRVARCSDCRKKVHRIHDHYKARTWRHLDMGGHKTILRYDTRRVDCPRCGVRVEEIPWAATGSNFTYDFEHHLAYLTQKLDKTSVSKLMRVAWRTVGDVVLRVVGRKKPYDLLDGLTHIGVDELCFRHNHQFITIVTDHKRGRVVWVGPGKNAEALGRFFQELGDKRSSKLAVVTLDMSAAYIKAVTAAAPQAQLIFDRFHVQRLIHDAVDEVRRAQVRETADSDDKKAVKGMRWPLLKNPWNLTRSEQEKMNLLQKTNRHLYRAYLLKESLLSILDDRWSNPGRQLDAWLSWASRCRLAPFVKLAGTVRKYKQGILAYVESGLSNARSEGINSKIRTVTRRAYGFHTSGSLIAMIFLCCAGIRLEPVFHRSNTVH